MNTGFGWRICCCFFGVFGVFWRTLCFDWHTWCFFVYFVFCLAYLVFCMVYLAYLVYFGVLCLLFGIFGFWFLFGILVGVIGVFVIGILYLLHLEFELVYLMFSSLKMCRLMFIFSE